MDYKDIKIDTTKRKKITILTYVVAAVFHLMLFFAFRIEFVPYLEIKVPKIIKIRRINIPRGKRPGPSSASAAKKRAKPKPVTKKALKRKPKKRVRKKPKIKSKITIPKKEKQQEPVAEETEIALDQATSEYDVLSMIEGDMVIPGGGNLGDDESAYGVDYDEGMVYDPESDYSIPAKKKGEKFVGMMATPVVTSIPPTSITKTFTDIPYPDTVKVKRENLRTGISRVWLRISINADGDISRTDIRSPKTQKEQDKYQIFIDAVMDTVETWDFDPTAATVFVDVRFDIE